MHEPGNGTLRSFVRMYVSAWRMVPVEDTHRGVWGGKLEMSYKAQDPMDELAGVLLAPCPGSRAVSLCLLENR